jgi:hypothetical protein
MKMGRSKRHRRSALALAAALLLAACGGPASEEPAIEEPATVEHVEGSPVARVTLTEVAVEKLGLRTAQVQEAGQRLLVPSAAVLVDPEGTFWVYTNPEPLEFIRHSITIDHQEGGQAFLVDGPPVGTRVVTVGVAELYGAEFEIGH